jgi:glycosyltransferase involved in cell wall biosynthesis
VQSPWRWWLHRAAVDNLGWYARFPKGGHRQILFLSAPDFIAKLQIFPWYYYRDHLRRTRGIEIREIPLDVFRNDPERYRDPRVDAVCFQTWFDLSQDQVGQLIATIRSAFPGAKLAYLDWFAPNDLRYAATALKHGVEVYLKKSLFKDRSRYKEETLGDTNLTDYYSRKFGIPSPATRVEVPEGFFSRFILGPNFYFSAGRVEGFLGSLPPNQERPIDLHCRIGTKGTPWYQAMREMARDRVRELKGLEVGGCEAVSTRKYLAELRHSKMCFSPFGYGEICLRDYEAVLAGALLIKPDMGHVIAEPDIFLPHETYVPVSWDYSDLQEKCSHYLKDEDARRRITHRAFQVIHDYLIEHRFLDRLDTLLGLLFERSTSPSNGSAVLLAPSDAKGLAATPRSAAAPGPVPPRVACIQQGDYGRARRRLAEGGPETYGSQRYTVDAFERFVDGVAHLVISLEAPSSRDRNRLGEYVGLGELEVPGLPRRWSSWWRASQVLKELEQFGPTHILLRCDDVIGCRILAWANRRRIPTAAILATRFKPSHPPCPRFCRLANDPNVVWVANHNRVATASLVECGLRPEKALAWDYPAQSNPDQNPPKTAPTSGTLSVVYAGSVIQDKGVLEAVQAVEQLRRTSPALRLSICGEGDLRKELSGHPGVGAGWLEVAGLLPSEQILARMRSSWLVVVPTRHAYPEALPLVITEALTTRTPVVLSDHPIFKAYFRDGAGVRLFRAEDSPSLAKVLGELLADPQGYASLSKQTAEIWASLQIDTKFHQLLERLAREWSLAAPKA